MAKPVTRRAVATACLVALCAFALVGNTPTAALTVTVNNVRSAEGQVRVAVYTKDNWLGQEPLSRLEYASDSANRPSSTPTPTLCRNNCTRTVAATGLRPMASTRRSASASESAATSTTSGSVASCRTATTGQCSRECLKGGTTARASSSRTQATPAAADNSSAACGEPSRAARSPSGRRTTCIQTSIQTGHAECSNQWNWCVSGSRKFPCKARSRTDVPGRLQAGATPPGTSGCHPKGAPT